MQIKSSIPGRTGDEKPWYMHPWPWLLMLGPFIVIVAGIHTTWLAISGADALVVDDYYKQGKAINQDLHRDRVASGMKLEMAARYDAAAGKLIGTILSHGKPQTELLNIRLIHSTRPEKDIKLQAQPDQNGNFSVDLPMLDMARWQVLVEGAGREWRLNGVWPWPQNTNIEIKAELPAA